MITRKQIAYIIEPEDFEIVQQDIEYYQTVWTNQLANGNTWSTEFGGWTQLVSNLKHNEAWQAVDRAWRKADQILEAINTERDPNLRGK